MTTVTETQDPPTSDELLADARRHSRRRRFAEMLGPEPSEEDAEELGEFLAFLEEQRHQPARYPGDKGSR